MGYIQRSLEKDIYAYRKRETLQTKQLIDVERSVQNHPLALLSLL